MCALSSFGAGGEVRAVHRLGKQLELASYFPLDCSGRAEQVDLHLPGYLQLTDHHNV
jgi:hypothetical protein